MHHLEPLRLALLVVHLIGLAIIIGPYLVKVTDLRNVDVRIPMAGAVVQFLTALGLVLMREVTEPGIGGGMVAVKVIVSLAVLTAVLVAEEVKRAKRPQPAWLHIGAALAIGNAAIAIVWADFRV